MKLTKQEHELYKAEYLKAHEALVVKLDKTERYFITLIGIAKVTKFENIPEKHRKNLANAIASVPWRANKHVVRTVKATARLSAQNVIKRERFNAKAK